MSLTHAYAPITKADKHDDGTMTVSGKATGPDLDLDEQICDANKQAFYLDNAKKLYGIA